MTELEKLSPQEWLEYHRRSHGYESVSLLGNKNLKKILEMSFPDDAQRLIGKFSTLTQAQLEDALIERYVASLRFTEKEAHLIKGVYFGIFPTFNLDGYADRTPKGDPIIMLHSGLVMTVMAWCNFTVYNFYEDNAEKFIQENPYVMARFLSAIGRLWKPELEFISDANPFPFSLSENSYFLSLQLVDACMAFIIGHECGHVMEEHHSYTSDQVYNHNMEFAADAWGLTMCMRHIIFRKTLLPYDPSRLTFLAPYVVLSMIAVIADIQEMTHPAATSRMEKITKRYRKQFSEFLGKDGFATFKKELGHDFVARTIRIGKTLFERHKRYTHVIDFLASQAASHSTPKPN